MSAGNGSPVINSTLGSNIFAYLSVLHIPRTNSVACFPYSLIDLTGVAVWEVVILADPPQVCGEYWELQPVGQCGGVQGGPLLQELG